MLWMHHPSWWHAGFGCWFQFQTMVPVMFYPNVLLKRPSTRPNGEASVDWLIKWNDSNVFHSNVFGSISTLKWPTGGGSPVVLALPNFTLRAWHKSRWWLWGRNMILMAIKPWPWYLVHLRKNVATLHCTRQENAGAGGWRDLLNVRVVPWNERRY